MSKLLTPYGRLCQLLKELDGISIVMASNQVEYPDDGRLLLAIRYDKLELFLGTIFQANPDPKKVVICMTEDDRQAWEGWKFLILAWGYRNSRVPSEGVLHAFFYEVIQRLERAFFKKAA